MHGQNNIKEVTFTFTGIKIGPKHCTKSKVLLVCGLSYTLTIYKRRRRVKSCFCQEVILNCPTVNNPLYWLIYLTSYVKKNASPFSGMFQRWPASLVKWKSHSLKKIIFLLGKQRWYPDISRYIQRHNVLKLRKGFEHAKYFRFRAKRSSKASAHTVQFNSRRSATTLWTRQYSSSWTGNT